AVAVSFGGDISGREGRRGQHGQRDQQAVKARNEAIHSGVVAVAATPAVASSPADADEELRAPAPAPPATLVSANTLTPPPGVDLLAFSGSHLGGFEGFVPAPVPLQASSIAKAAVPPAESPEPKHKNARHAKKQVQHRISSSTLAMLLVGSGCLGFLVVSRQAKVLLNKPRGDFREEVAKALSRSSQARSSQDIPREELLEAHEEASRRHGHRPLAQATAKAAPGASEPPLPESVEIPEQLEQLEQLEHLEGAEADAAGGGTRSRKASTTA
ncbi:unnamed protein product, partial [Symbiodinium natans]